MIFNAYRGHSSTAWWCYDEFRKRLVQRQDVCSVTKATNVWLSLMDGAAFHLLPPPPFPLQTPGQPLG